MNTNTPPTSPKPGDSYVQSFARGLEVIRSFSATAPQQTLSEVAARVRPVCAATSLSVGCGAVALNARITSRPGANGCT